MKLKYWIIGRGLRNRLILVVSAGSDPTPILQMAAKRGTIVRRCKKRQALRILSLQRNQKIDRNTISSTYFYKHATLSQIVSYIDEVE